jgi:hypothetical protein
VVTALTRALNEALAELAKSPVEINCKPVVVSTSAVVDEDEQPRLKVRKTKSKNQIFLNTRPPSFE